MNLFNPDNNTYPETDISKINGLVSIGNYLTRQEHDILLNTIDDQPWMDDLKRRVQHYGYKYDYRARRIDLTMRIGELPNWARDIADKLLRDGFFKEIPDQLIVNEYFAGQGITPHIDCEPCFEDTIASISLGSTCVIDFTNQLTSEKIAHLLTPCSLVILKEDSRYNWTHGIAPRKSDKYQGQTYPRHRRVSLTFRKTILE